MLFCDIYYEIHFHFIALCFWVYLDTKFKLFFFKAVLKWGRWHNGSAFVFCSCSCMFESEPSPTSAHACGEVTGCAPAAQRSASVAPEVNLGEYTLHLPLQK